MAKKHLNDGDLENLSGGADAVDVALTGKERPTPTTTPAGGSNPLHGGNLMENTEQDHDADGR